MPAVKPPVYVLRILDRLESAGFETYCVGGAVRDSLLGINPSDWDLATSARPEEVKAALSGFTLLPTGARHGTLTAVLGDERAEITTFRKDGVYSDLRHPDEVVFSKNIEDDLGRRDFTVNAIAYSPRRGLIDPFCGLGDLDSRLMRAVGDPEVRFAEDPLRILRMLRFCAVLGFRAEDATAYAGIKLSGLITAVSKERLRDEMTGTLLGRDAERVLRDFSEIVFAALPNLSAMRDCPQLNPHHAYGVWEHSLRTVGYSPQNPISRWAALLHDCGKPSVRTRADGVDHFYGHVKASEEICGEVLSDLRFPKREADAIIRLVSLHGEVLPIPEKRLRKLAVNLGGEELRLLLSLIEADIMAQGTCAERLQLLHKTREDAERILKEKPAPGLRDLKIDGHDLIALGFSPSPALGAALSRLLKEVADGELPNERDALLNRALAIKNTD